MSQIFSLLLIATAAWTSASGLPESTQASNEEFITGTWRIDGYLD